LPVLNDMALFVGLIDTSKWATTALAIFTQYSEYTLCYIYAHQLTFALHIYQ
jgi:hypothetical protein